MILFLGQLYVKLRHFSFVLLCTKIYRFSVAGTGRGRRHYTFLRAMLQMPWRNGDGQDLQPATSRACFALKYCFIAHFSYLRNYNRPYTSSYGVKLFIVESPNNEWFSYLAIVLFVFLMAHCIHSGASLLVLCCSTMRCFPPSCILRVEGPLSGSSIRC